MTDALTLDAVASELFSRSPESDVAPDLSRISALMDLLGHPETSARVIHVAGTNGKTSTSRMIDSIVRSLGLRTGLYTSPHLTSVTERIRVDGRPLGDDQFIALYREIRPLVEMVDQRSVGEGGPRMTFFEVVTGMAFAAFADAPVDVMILEVGMGGTWDATNVADADVAVVMPVGLDHTDWLGETIAQIAAEKAGIVTEGCQVVLAHQEPAAAEVLLRRCAESGATVAREGSEFGVMGSLLAVGGQQVSIQGLYARYDDVFLPVHGVHQAGNAACAVAAVEALTGRALDGEALGQALIETDTSGRLEVLRTGPTIMIDAAHNPAGARVLADSLERSFDFASVIAIVAVLQEKDAEGFLAELDPAVTDIIVTGNSSPRALPTTVLAAVAEEIVGAHRLHTAEDLPAALDLAVALADERASRGPVGIVATGSVVTAGDVRRLLGA